MCLSVHQFVKRKLFERNGGQWRMELSLGKELPGLGDKFPGNIVIIHLVA